MFGFHDFDVDIFVCGLFVFVHISYKAAGVSQFCC